MLMKLTPDVKYHIVRKKPKKCHVLFEWSYRILDGKLKNI